jgi:hypothetical protein
MDRSIVVLACLAIAVPAAALAETLYKLIDKNGKVTYAQEKPKYFDGEVVEVRIDPNANKATLPKYTPPPPAPNAKAAAGKDPLAQARARVDAARKAYENARDNPAEGEVQRIGKVGGGTRPVPSPEYEQRLARLEAELKEAEQDLRKLQAGR